MTALPRVAVLLSGRGSNLQALLAAARAPGYPAAIVLAIGDGPAATGLAHAREAGIEAVMIDRTAHPDRAAFEEAIDRRLRDGGIDLVCLAGFMRRLSPAFVESWPDRLLNIHPSLLPAYRGLDTHARALADGVRIHGCTVYYVRAALDAGPIIVQAAVPVLPDDDERRLAARVLAAEHRCYPLALRQVAEGRAPVVDGRVPASGGPLWLGPEDGGTLLNPGG